jgi:hypothetical protein
MNQFLDACWLYGDRKKIASIYMQPVVMSTTYGEREGTLTLENAWEILGGIPCSGLCGYVDDLVNFEMNQEFTHIIEKKAENLYRTISQKSKGLPTSNQAVTQRVQRTQQPDLTPQESEQLSQYVANDTYVKKQREDIEELSEMFRGMMGQDTEAKDTEFIMELKSHFTPKRDFKARYLFVIHEKTKPLFVGIDGNELDCHYGQEEDVDVHIKVSQEVMTQLVMGQMTFQRAFSVGEMTAMGDFRTIRMLDEVFGLV